jgi:hypothetical protein
MRRRITRRTFTRLFFFAVMPILIVFQVALAFLVGWHDGWSMATILTLIAYRLVFALAASIFVYVLVLVLLPPDPR